MATADHAVEQRLRLVDIAGQHIGVGEPEAAGEKRAFDRLLFIGDLAGIVPQHESVPHHVFFDRRDGAANARVRGRQEAHRRQQQDAGIEQLRAIGFDERIQPGIKALFADIAMDGIAQPPPAIERRVEAESFRRS